MLIKHDKLFSYYVKITFIGVISATFLLVLISLLSVIQPQIGSRIVDILEIEHTNNTMTMLIKFCLIYFIIGFIISIIDCIKNILLERIYKKTTRKARTDMLDTISNFTYEKIKMFDKGFVYSRINNSAERMSTLFSLTLPTLFSNILFLILVVIAISFESKMFALILTGIIIVSLVVISFLIFYGRKFLSLSNRNGLKRHGQYIETLNGIKYIKMHRMTQKLIEKLEKKTKNEYQYAMKMIVVNSSVNSFVILGENITIALIIMVGFNKLGITDMFSIAQIYLLITYIRKVFEPIYQIVNEFDKMQKSISSYMGIKRLLDFEYKLNGEKKLKEFKDIIKKIEFDNVSYSFNKEMDALKNASFKIRAGEKVALIGEVGKHTIIDLMMKLLVPKNGQIRVNDIPLKKIDATSVRNKIIMIEQEPSIFKGTLLDNIVLYEKNPDINKVEKILKDTKLDKFFNRNSQIQENAKNVSTGERQLISLARAMYKEGEIYVWHETTSMLDIEIQNTINRIINKMTENKTLLIIAHRPNTIKTCNRVLNVGLDGVNEIKMR